MTPTTSLNPTVDANLLASSTRVLSNEFQDLTIDQLTATFGVYDEEIDLSEDHSEGHHVSYGRPTRTTLARCL